MGRGALEVGVDDLEEGFDEGGIGLGLVHGVF
jgi:hypothetical protein